MGWGQRRQKEHMGNHNGNGKAPLSFTAPAGTPILGQPFTVTGVGMPMNMTLKCNCGGPAEETALIIEMSKAVTCPCCKKVYNALFNPGSTPPKIEMHVGLPKPEDTQVPA